MTAFVFKPRRKLKGRTKVSRLYSGRYRIERDSRTITVALGVTDKQVAETRLREIVRRAEQAAAGIGVPVTQRKAAEVDLEKHLCAYLRELEVKGRAGMYCYNVDHRCRRLFVECEWKHLKEISADSFQAWRSRNQQKAAKTLNQYLDTIRGLLGWLVRNGKLAADPLACVGKVETRGRERRKRRAFTDAEMRALLAVAGTRGPVYLLAANTGLRRGEIVALRKGDFHLTGDRPYVTARASTTKNRKEARQWLNAETAEAMRLTIPTAALASEAAFDYVPSIEKLRSDLKKAGIEAEDADGRRLDFHALRYTYATNLARAGVAPRVAMEMLRHSDMRLTNTTYTDVLLLPLAEAVEKLPRFGGNDTPIHSPKSGADGLDLAPGGTVGTMECVSESAVFVGQSHELAQPGTPGQVKGMVPRLGLEPRTN
ncbi:MAG: site-specific integrase [Verrucomicrobiales bacterium]|nr:site-specific integrase [Verrucomicrobiales bacterium]